MPIKIGHRRLRGYPTLSHNVLVSRVSEIRNLRKLAEFFGVSVESLTSKLTEIQLKTSR